MRPRLMIAALTVTLGATGAMAKVAPETPQPARVIALPQAYNGYSQPEIGQCETTGALERTCTVPAMTAGRYLIEAAANATSTAAGATQALSIKLGGAPCVGTRPAPFTGKAGLHVGCEVNFLTDQALTVTAVYVTVNGTADAKGPQLVFRRIPWNGIVDARGIAFTAKPKAPPAKK